MTDPEIVALREKLTNRPRSDDYRPRRRDIDERGLAYGLRPDVKVEPVTANGVRAEWSSTPGATDDAALLYLHGGGYVIGSLDSHRHLVAEKRGWPTPGGSCPRTRVPTPRPPHLLFASK